MCLEHPIMLEKKHLECLKNSKVAQSIRINFDSILVRRRTCRECAEAIPREANFSPLYDLDYLMMKAEPNGFGGYWAHIIFKESPTRIYRLWLYPIDENTFQLRDIGTIIPTAKIKKTMTTLSGTKYSKYWITSKKTIREIKFIDVNHIGFHSLD